MAFSIHIVVAVVVVVVVSSSSSSSLASPSSVSSSCAQRSVIASIAAIIVVCVVFVCWISDVVSSMSSSSSLSLLFFVVFSSPRFSCFVSLVVSSSSYVAKTVQAMPTLLSWLVPRPAVQGMLSPEANGEKLMQLIMNDRLHSEVQSAVEFVKTRVPMTPKGKQVGARTLADIRDQLTELDSTTIASGSLTALQLEVNAVGTLDAGRIHYLMTAADTTAELRKLIGTIVINGDLLPPAAPDVPDGEGGRVVDQPLNLSRLNKDAEVHTLCLLIYWTKSQALIDLASDLVFEYVHGGIGSKSTTYSLRLINKEEEKRKATHFIYCRRCRPYAFSANVFVDVVIVGCLRAICFTALFHNLIHRRCCYCYRSPS